MTWNCGLAHTHTHTRALALQIRKIKLSRGDGNFRLKTSCMLRSGFGVHRQRKGGFVRMNDTPHRVEIGMEWKENEAHGKRDQRRAEWKCKRAIKKKKKEKKNIFACDAKAQWDRQLVVIHLHWAKCEWCVLLTMKKRGRTHTRMWGDAKFKIKTDEVNEFLFVLRECHGWNMHTMILCVYFTWIMTLIRMVFDINH